jgi:hypothetical protein
MTCTRGPAGSLSQTKTLSFAKASLYRSRDPSCRSLLIILAKYSDLRRGVVRVARGAVAINHLKRSRPNRRQCESKMTILQTAIPRSAQMQTLEAAIFDVDGVLLASPMSVPGAKRSRVLPTPGASPLRCMRLKWRASHASVVLSLCGPGGTGRAGCRTAGCCLCGTQAEAARGAGSCRERCRVLRASLSRSARWVGPWPLHRHQETPTK